MNLSDITKVVEVTCDGGLAHDGSLAVKVGQPLLVHVVQVVAAHLLRAQDHRGHLGEAQNKVITVGYTPDNHLAGIML